MFDPTGYIIFWIIGFGPILILGAWLGRITMHIPTSPLCHLPHLPRCEHRACGGCGALYHESWNGDGEEPLCPNCSGAT